MNKIIILGPQACGKGTQGKILSDFLNIPRISTGDIFRNEITKKSDLGLKVQSLIQNGQLVSDELTFNLVKERLSNEDCKNGFILDGYPRNINQTRLLNEIVEIDYVIEIDITNQEAVKRIQTRRICDKCGTGYDLNLFPPKTEGKCDKCDGNIIMRPDDNEEAILKRLSIYRNEVKDILVFYKEKGILKTVNGLNTVENIAKEIKDIVIK